LVWLAIFLLVVVASGWRPRITGIIHFWISLSFINSAMLIEGGDQIVSNLALLLLPICLMDSRKWHWDNKAPDDAYIREKNLISNFFLFLIRLQVCIIYFHSAVGKMFVEEWRNGTAIYYWFNDPVFGMVDQMKLIINPILYNSFAIVLLTWGTIFTEIILSMGLLMQKQYRKYLLVSGILFHFCIVFVHGLFSFFLAMTGALILYLGPLGDEIAVNVKKYRISFQR
jgi:antimicrobial peptide system SdpB family protein